MTQDEDHEAGYGHAEALRRAKEYQRGRAEVLKELRVSQSRVGSVAVEDDLTEAIVLLRAAHSEAVTHELHGKIGAFLAGFSRSSTDRLEPDVEAVVEDVEKLRRLGDEMARAIFDLRMHEGRSAWDAAEIARANWLSEVSRPSTDRTGSVAVEDVRARTIAEIVRALQTEPVIPDDMEDGLYEPVEALKCAAVWIWREFSRSSTDRPEQPEPDVLGGQPPAEPEPTGGTSDA